MKYFVRYLINVKACPPRLSIWERLSEKRIDRTHQVHLCVMDVYYICVGAVLVMIGVRIFIIL